MCYFSLALNTVWLRYDLDGEDGPSLLMFGDDGGGVSIIRLEHSKKKVICRNVLRNSKSHLNKSKLN